jgi:acetylglutamate kinase
MLLAIKKSKVMEKAIEKADVLIEAMQWIREFRGKITVIKLGGSVMQDPHAMTQLLVDVVFMETVGMKPVIVHGGGAAISRAMSEANIEPRFVQGRRYTDSASLKIVEQVLGGEINNKIVDEINSLGGRAQPLSLKADNNVLFGERLLLPGPEDTAIELGYVGRVNRVDTEAIRDCCDNWIVPVIPSICFDEEEKCPLNVNADTAATAVAQALKAEKLVFLSDVNGVRQEADNPDSLLHSLTAGKARELIENGAVAGGMIPKVQGCLETLEKGVRKIHIIDGRLRHSLLLEVYTSKGVGTEIFRDE